MSQFIKEIDDDQLSALIASGKTVVCDFWAPWCTPCRMLAPIMEKLAEEFSEKAEFVKVNTDENGEIAGELGITGIPDVFIFENGTVKTDHAGFYPEAVLRDFFQKNL